MLKALSRSSPPGRPALLPESGVVFAFLASAWSVLAGLVLLLLVVWRLSPAEQGYYFTFSSLLLTQQFLELGFGVVLTQFVSHEWAALSLSGDGSVAGPAATKARLGSLVRLGLGWYGAASLLYFGVVGGAGYLFFRTTGAGDVSWAAPWWLLSAVAALGILAVPLSSLLEGRGRVASNQGILLCANVVGGLAAWTALLAGAGLFSLSLLLGARALIGLPLLLLAARPLLRLMREKGTGVSWRREFWPQQWRISLSWCAGLVMFQSFAPITFSVQGPVAAGQVGATLQAYHAINRLSSAWLVAVQPRMGQLGAQRRFDDLKGLVAGTTRRAVVSAAILSGATLAALTLVHAAVPAYAARFAGLVPTGVFLLALTAMQVGNVMTAAVRFQKREPFVLNALAGAALVAASSVILGGRFGIDGIALGFAAIMLAVVLPWTVRIYTREMNAFGARARGQSERPVAAAALQ